MAIWLPPLPDWFPGRTLHQSVTAYHRTAVQQRLAARQQAATAQTPPSQGQGRRAGGSWQPSGSLDVRPGQHWLIGGMTGCGKTTFAKPLAAYIRALMPQPILYIDSKGGEFSDVAGLHLDRQQPPTLAELFSGEYSEIVWTPERDAEQDYDALFEQVLKARRPLIIVVDELSSLGGKSGQSFPLNFARALKQGRALNITLIVLTQELAYISRQVLYQTMHLVMMLFDPESFDAKRASQLAGLPAVNVPFAFNYRNRALPLQRWRYRDFRQFFGVSRAHGTQTKGTRREK